jgi:outer membrane lipoprotein-sorting protein
MKLIKSCIVFFMLVAPVLLFAQDRPFEQKGEELLKEAARKIKGFSSMRIEFISKIENESQNMSEEMKGTLITKGEKYRMEVGDNLFISDGETLWSYMGMNDEVHINSVEDTDGGMTPTSILEGFETGFRSKFIRQERHNGRLVDVIDLLPTGPQAFYKYRVALDASTRMIVYTSAYDRHGGVYTYELTRIDQNPRVNDNLFTFDTKQYPGLEIIDLR